MDAGTETNANLDHQLYYHFLGTDQSEDILCWENPDNPQYTLGASVTEDGKVKKFIYKICVFLHRIPMKLNICPTSSFAPK